jgi:ABC-type amino acid transport substrate-binding protein
MVSYALAHRDVKTIHPGVLTIATFDKFYPIAFYEKKDKTLDGLEVRLMRAYAAAVGLTPRFVRISTWDGIWDKPRLKEADVAIGGIANTYNRVHKDTEWTMPYYYVNRSVIYLKKSKRFPYSVAAIEGSTGDIDVKMRPSELMGTVRKGLGKTRDLVRLRDGKIDGIMYGDQVSRSIIRNERKKDLRILTWSMVPTLVPRDGETFCFPTRLGSGIAVSLSAFLVQAAESGLLKKICRSFKVTYPVFPVKNLTVKNHHNPYKKKPNPAVLKKLIRDLLLAPSLQEEREKFREKVVSFARRILTDYEHHDERIRLMLQNKSAIDSSFIEEGVKTALSQVSSLVTKQHYPTKPMKCLRPKKGHYCYNIKPFEDDVDTGDNLWFEYIDFNASAGDAPLVRYRNNTCSINTEKVMQKVRASGNTKKALFEEILETGCEVIVHILQAESGIKNVKTILKL